jgi:hypothetical protein
MKNLSVVLMILCIASVSQAVMLADFETGVNGFSATGTPVSTLETSTTAGSVTSGLQSLKVTHGAGNYWPIRWTPSSVPTQLGKLSFDLTCFAADWPTQPWTRFCEKISLHTNVTGGGWVEYLTTTANWTHRATGLQAPVDWGAWDGDCVRTCVIDISNFAYLEGATEFWINFSFNCATAGPYYLDNIHFVDEPYNPNPEDGGVGIIGVDTTLSWNNATDSLNFVKVWFAETPVESPTDPNTILSLDTYKNLLTNIYTEMSPGATSSCPMPALTDGDEYTWAVESDPNTVPVLFWTFIASTNNPPVADAGADQYKWLGPDPNAVILITLDGSASTDDHVEQLSYHWVQTAGATAAITDPNAAVTTVTLPAGLANTTEAGAGAPYVFELTVDDGQFNDTDTVTVTVNTDSCRASIQAGSFYFFADIAGPGGAGDDYRDCKVDLYDLAETAVNWLGCSNTFESCD